MEQGYNQLADPCRMNVGDVLNSFNKIKRVRKAL